MSGEKGWVRWVDAEGNTLLYQSAKDYFTYKRMIELEAENERLRGDRELRQVSADTLLEWERQNDELRAENAQLRKALQAIIDNNKIVFCDWPEYFSTRIAREALK